MKGYRNISLFGEEDDFKKFEEIANKIDMSTTVLVEIFIHELVKANEDKEYKSYGERGILEFYKYWEAISTGKWQ